MNKESNHLKELRELNESYKGKEIEQVLGITIRSVQNYLKPGSKRKPSPETIRKISEAFANHQQGRPLGYTDKIEENLQEQDSEAQSRRTLEETLKNMSKDKLHSTEIIKMLAEDKLRNTAIFEKLTALLETSINSGRTLRDPVGHSASDIGVGDQVPVQDFDLDKKYQDQGNKVVKKGK